MPPFSSPDYLAVGCLLGPLFQRNDGLVCRWCARNVIRRCSDWGDDGWFNFEVFSLSDWQGMSTQAYLFDAGGTDREVALDPLLVSQLNDQHLLWIDLATEEPGAWEDVVALLELREESVAWFTTPGRPQVRHFGDYTHVHVTAVGKETHRYVPIPLHLVAGKNYLLSLHGEEIAFLEEVRTFVQGDTRLGQLDSAAFLAALLDRHIESYLLLLDPLEASVDRLDEQVMRESSRAEDLETMVTLRHRVGELRRLLTPHRSVYGALARPDYAVFVGDEPDPHLATLSEHFERAVEATEHARELVLGSFQLYTARASERTNDIMRVLTVTTVVLGIVAAAAGLLGTNFEASVFKTGDTGFRAVLVGSAAMVLMALIVARWRRWL